MYLYAQVIVFQKIFSLLRPGLEFCIRWHALLSGRVWAVEGCESQLETGVDRTERRAGASHPRGA